MKWNGGGGQPVHVGSIMFDAARVSWAGLDWQSESTDYSVGAALYAAARSFTGGMKVPVTLWTDDDSYAEGGRSKKIHLRKESGKELQLVVFELTGSGRSAAVQESIGGPSY